MTLGREIESVRIKRHLSVIDVCNAMNVSESEYRHIVMQNKRPTTYQLIMFLSLARHHLEKLL